MYTGMKIPDQKIFYHIIAWIAFLFFDIFIALVAADARPMPLRWMIFYSLCIFFFYFNAHIVFAYITNTKKTWYEATLLVLLELFLFFASLLGVRHLITLFLSDPPIGTSVVVSYFSRCVYFLGLSTTYWLTLNIIEKNKRISQLEIARVKAEKDKTELQNAYLLAQLNPHLLFNALNFVYNSVRRVSADAASGVALLADIMGHTLRGTGEDGKVALADEVDHIRKIVELCRLRNHHEVYLDLLIEGEADAQRIPPLVLVTFVENVIKHGDLTEARHPAKIGLRIHQKHIHLHTENLKKNADIGVKHQTGIRNAQRRMQELYPEEAVALSIEDTGSFYTVQLNISL